jgi:CubicO group peptidase (beta-lactamase class C family)
MRSSTRTFIPAVLASLIAHTAVTGSLLAQPLPSDSAIRAIIQPRVDAGRFAGIAVGLVSRDNQRRVVAYGPTAGVTKFDGNTVFEIGSITKTFTAAILADMVRKGEVSLADPVAKLLPAGTVVPQRNGKQITLLDLATQSSGLPRMPDNLTPKDNDNPYADYTVAQMYAFLARYTLPRDPGEKYEYSNLGVGLLGHALALRAGKSYEQLVTERVLAPLGMKDTRIALTPDLQKRLAPGHTDTGKPISNWDLPTFAGAGALRSTVNDMLAYIRANADSTATRLGPTLALAHLERHAGPAATTALGLAWHRTRMPSGHLIVWHNGGTGGYRSFTGYDEGSGLGVVVLTSTSNSVDEIGMHLLDASVPLPVIPKARKEVILPAASLDRYVGVFEAAPTFVLTITHEGTRLFLQATNQPKFEIFAEAEDEFFLKVVDAQISFAHDASGAVTSLVLHQNGQNLAAKKRQ